MGDIPSPRDLPLPLSVLVVDDNLDTVETTSELLNLHGFRVLTATNGAEALRIAAAEHPRVVLTDIMMPGLDGYELARRLRAGEGRPVLVAVTGCVSAGDRAEGIVAGFDHHLAKPVDPAVLLDLLKQVAFAFQFSPLPAPA